MHRITLLILLCLPGLLMAQKPAPNSFIKPAPKPVRMVNDYAHFLTTAETKSIEKELKQYRTKSTNVIVIITLDSLTDKKTQETYTIEKAALQYFNTWGIGEKAKNNGVLIMATRKERKVRIEVGLGLEQALTNEESAAIIAQNIVPNFKQKQYAKGFKEAIQAIEEQLNNPQEAATAIEEPINAAPPAYSVETETVTAGTAGSFSYWWLLGPVMIILLGIAIARGTANGGGMYTGSGYYENGNWINDEHTHYNHNRNDDVMIFSGGNDSYSSGDSGSSSGDSGSSDSGGGSSDGGGASGDW